MTVPLRGATRTRVLPGQTQPLPVVARQRGSGESGKCALTGAGQGER